MQAENSTRRETAPTAQHDDQAAGPHRKMPGRFDVVRLTAKGEQLLAEFELNAKKRIAAAGKSTKQIGARS